MATVVQFRPNAEPAGHPPHSIEAEQAVLGSALVNNAVLDLCQWLSVEDFFEPVHGRIWEAMAENVRAGRSADPVMLKRLFDADPSLLELDGGHYVARMGAVAEPIARAVEYARLVKRHARLRELRSIGEAVALEAVRPEADDAATIWAGYAKRLDAILVDHSRPIARSAAQVCDQVIAEMEQPRPYWTLGIPALDKSLGGGIHEGYVIGFEARPKQFKTGVAHTVLLALARQQVRSAYFALEMGSARLGRRMLGHVGGFNSGMFNHADAYTISRAIEASRELRRLPLWFADRPGMKFSELKATTNQLMTSLGVRVFVLDYWQLVQPDQPRKDKADFLAEVAQWCADHAHEHGTTWIICSQQNRTGDSYGSDGLAKACDWHAVLHKHEQPYLLGNQRVETLWMDVKYARDSTGDSIGDEKNPVLMIDPRGPHLAQLP